MTKLKSASRFKAKFGSSLKKIYAGVEAKYKSKRLKCPYCNKFGVKRVAFGIWNCRLCSSKFTGKAYEI